MSTSAPAVSLDDAPAVSLVDAILDKYDTNQGEMGGNIICFLPGKANLPPRLTMDNSNISVMGDDNNIREMCSKVQELDLTKNAITDWAQVFKILQHMECLEFINLTKNCLDNDTGDCISGIFPNIHVLVLNGTGIPGATVSRLLHCLPNLNELHLSVNPPTSIDISSSTTYPAITKLFCNSCDITQWEQISNIGHAFPNLEALTIIQNKIETLSEDFSEFQSLKTLNISQAPFKSWEEIDKFRKFPVLTNLRISEIPFIEKMAARDRRQHLIARLPNIVTLKGSKISDDEREDADRAFIRFYMEQHEQPQRYSELVSQYGQLDPLVNVDMSRKTTVKMKVILEDEKEEIMDISIEQTVGQLKKMLQKFAGMPMSQFQVIHYDYLDGVLVNTPEIKIKFQRLTNLNFTDGDELLVLSRFGKTTEEGLPMSQFKVIHSDYADGVLTHTSTLKFNYQIKNNFTDGDELLVLPKFVK